MKALLPKSKAFFSPICLLKLNLKKIKQLTSFLSILSIVIKLFFILIISSARMSCYTLHIVIGCRKIFGNGLTYNILGFSVYLYHFHTSTKNCNKKGSHRFDSFRKIFVSPNVLYQASLRWHYPNQVLGRRSHLPLSLSTSSRLFSCEYIIHLFYINF